MNSPDSKKINLESLTKSVQEAYNPEPLIVDGVSHNISFHGNQKQQERVKKVVNFLEQSEHGRYLLDKAKESNFTIGFEPTLGDMGVCSYENRSILINDNVSEAMAVSILAHELRHACQFSNGINLYAESDNTKTQIQINRAMEADAEANAGLVALELKKLGFEEPWNEFKKDGPEVAKSIDEELKKTNGELEKNKSKILLAGFKGWYNDFNIREQYDSQQIEILDKIREDNIMNLVGFDRYCPSDIIIRKICKTSEKSNYFSDNKESPSLIDSKHFLGVSRKNMDKLLDYFKERKEKHNIQPDDSLEEIPTYKYLNEKRGHQRGNAKSVYWEKVVTIKKQKSKLQQAIEANKQRYVEQQNIPTQNIASSLLNKTVINLR